MFNSATREFESRKQQPRGAAKAEATLQKEAKIDEGSKNHGAAEASRKGGWDKKQTEAKRISSRADFTRI